MRFQLPQSRRSARLVVALLCSPGLLVYFFIGRVFLLNHRISRELMNQQWRTPTEIIATGSGSPVLVAKVYGRDWRPTPPIKLEAVPPHVAKAFVAAEDVRFWKHHGIDTVGIFRALVRNVKSRGIAQGGSTINQQLIKGKFLTQERTLRRKAVEALMATVLDFRLSKEEILEAYLNDVYLGHFKGQAVLGVDEAARLFFDKRPSQLSAAEAALLAGTIRAPNRDTPEKRPERARARRDAILAVMKEEGWLADSDYQRAIRSGVRLSHGRLPPSAHPFYVGALRSELLRTLGKNVVSIAGLKVFCPLNLQMQASAERAARRGAQALESRHEWLRNRPEDKPLQTAILSLDPVTGGIRALVGGADYRRSSFDRTTYMKRQPGSAFKTFAFLAAIESKKATNATLLLDAPVRIELAKNDIWEPHNYDEKYRGRVTVRECFEKSLNVPTVRLSQQIGMKRIVKMADRAGMGEDLPDTPALSLGVAEVSMRDLTSAYTIFPNLGKRVSPFLVAEVRDRKGEVIYKHEEESEKVVDAASAYVVHTLLRGVVLHGTAARLKRYGLGHVAGKTGTTNDYRDAWFVGYTPDLVTTVWAGYDDGSPLRLSSAEAALPIWGAYIGDIRTNRKEIVPPKGVVFRQVDPETGYIWSEGCPGPVHEAFLSGTAPARGCPRGIMGQIVRKVLFDRESFDEPAAITFDQFRRWTADVDRNRKQIEKSLDKVRSFLGGDDDEVESPDEYEERESEEYRGESDEKREKKGKGRKKRKDD